MGEVSGPSLRSKKGSGGDSLRIVFLAGTRNAKLFRNDPSFVYRCDNLGLALQAAGHRVRWLHWKQFRPSQRYDVAVFHRPRYSLPWRILVSWLRRCGTRLVADFDDLVFDPQTAQYSPGVLNGIVTLKKTRQQYASHSRALALFGRVSVSTRPLADHAQRCLPAANVQVVPNSVHRSWRDAQRTAREAHTPLVISYFPGTRSHDRDFALYADGVARFLAAHPAARLIVTGPLQFDLLARPGQVVRREKVPFSAYARHVQGAWVNLAPLESTPFSRCKSALKVLEAGCWGIPTICTPIPDAEQFAAAGAVFAADAGQCFEALQSLLEPACYAACTQGLSERVLRLANVNQVGDAFLEWVAADPAGGSGR